MAKIYLKPIVSVIIPNYNGVAIISTCLEKVLAAKKVVANRILEVIVVDDNSFDQSAELITRDFPEVRLIKHKINRGFARAVNMGVINAKGEIMVLINSDVLVEKDFLVKALNHFKDNKVFAVSLHEEGYAWAIGVFENGFINHKPGIDNGLPHNTFWVSGGSGLFRRSLYLELGGMDFSIYHPFYWEDVDLSYRAVKRGFRLLWEPGGLVHHKHEATIGRVSSEYKQRIVERNQLLFIWINLTSQRLFKRHLSGLIKRLSTHPGYLRIILMALTKIFLVIPKRKKEINESKVSDEAIFAAYENN